MARQTGTNKNTTRAAKKAALQISSECLNLRARRLSRLITRIYDDALRPHGLKAPQLSLLAAIALMTPAKQSELGQVLDLEKSTLSRSVGRMIDKGWIRTSTSGSGRVLTLSLTKVGEQLLRDIVPAWRKAQKQAHRLIGSDGLRALDEMAPALR
ncbi:MAG: MarR family winged helix-turn-helix transcriptional regulator [Proteobacteria bacterium]|nr:MarR family winged helix-turn-helix transcriptional regulator [Pseudomonadota bacterium]